MVYRHQRSTPQLDKNHMEVPYAMRDRCGGYSKDKELGCYYANLHGLRVAAYDTAGVGNGFPDWIVFVSWFCIGFEVKQERATGKGKTKLTDDQYYQGELKDKENKVINYHPSIIVIVWDRNQVYEYLCRVSDFVLFCEGVAEGSKELLALFFPKVNSVNSEETT